MTMPHRGRPKYGFMATPIRHQLLKLDGIREVIVDFTWEPKWTIEDAIDEIVKENNVRKEKKGRESGRRAFGNVLNGILTVAVGLALGVVRILSYAHSE